MKGTYTKELIVQKCNDNLHWMTIDNKKFLKEYLEKQSVIQFNRIIIFTKQFKYFLAYNF